MKVAELGAEPERREGVDPAQAAQAGNLLHPGRVLDQCRQSGPRDFRGHEQGPDRIVPSGQDPLGNDSPNSIRASHSQLALGPVVALEAQIGGAAGAWRYGDGPASDRRAHPREPSPGRASPLRSGSAPAPGEGRQSSAAAPPARRRDGLS